MIEPTLPANASRIKSLRLAQKWTQEDLADKAGCSKRTVENAEAGKRIKEALLECIAQALGIDLAEITSVDSESIDQYPAPIPGNPEYYIEALKGTTWRSVATRPPQIDREGRAVEGRELEYDVTVLSTRGNTVTASCHCVSKGFEHERFNLKAVVDGQGILMIDGYRDVPDGAVHFFRSIMQYHSDGKSKMMEGGFVVFDLDPSGIFVGRMKSVPHAASESQRAQGDSQTRYTNKRRTKSSS